MIDGVYDSIEKADSGKITKYWCKYNFPYRFLKMQSWSAGKNICSTPNEDNSNEEQIRWKREN